MSLSIYVPYRDMGESPASVCSCRKGPEDLHVLCSDVLCCFVPEFSVVTRTGVYGATNGFLCRASNKTGVSDLWLDSSST